ncbi:MAG TPA: DUF202 domain-containing protein, partial [Steroidobacteraceae bacterium]
DRSKEPNMSYSPDPRVLFAAERTLLAWQRSAIALMGFGFVVERFGLFNLDPLVVPPGYWTQIGVALNVVIAVIAVLFAAHFLMSARSGG